MTQKNDTEQPHITRYRIPRLNKDYLAEFIESVMVRHKHRPSETIEQAFEQTRKNLPEFTDMSTSNLVEAWEQVRKVHTHDRNDFARVCSRLHIDDMLSFTPRDDRKSEKKTDLWNLPMGLPNPTDEHKTDDELQKIELIANVKHHQDSYPKSTLENSFMRTLIQPAFRKLTKHDLRKVREELGLPKAATVETATVELKDKDESKFMQLSSKQLNEHFVKLDAALKQALADSNTVPSVCLLLPGAKENRAAQAQIEPEPCPVTIIEGLDRFLDRRVAHNQRKKAKKSKRSSHLTEIDIEHVLVGGKPMIKILEFRNVATASDLPVGYSTKYPKYFKYQCISGKAGILLYTKLNTGLVVSSTIVQHDLLTRTEFDGIVTTMKQAGQRLTDINKKAKEAKQVRKETIVI